MSPNERAVEKEFDWAYVHAVTYAFVFYVERLDGFDWEVSPVAVSVDVGFVFVRPGGVHEFPFAVEHVAGDVEFTLFARRDGVADVFDVYVFRFARFVHHRDGVKRRFRVALQQRELRQTFRVAVA